MPVTRLTANEKRDRIALRLARGPAVCIQRDIVRATDKATLARLVKRGWIERDVTSEYTDAVALTYDGTDYLSVLEESWHD
jgi:hypothetical protein